jgi:ABC-type multidrug transport system fused ATPase/permease subunit
MNSRRLLEYIMLSRLPWRYLILFISFCASIAGIISPLLQKIFIDQLLKTSNTNSTVFYLNLDDYSPLYFIFLSFLFIILAQALSLYTSYLGMLESRYLQEKLSEMVYLKTLSIHADSLKGKTVGEMVALYATDVMGATIFLEQTIPSGAATIFPLIIAPAVLYWAYDLPLQNIVLTMLFVIVLNSFLALRQSVFFMRYKQLAAERIGLVNEWIQNIRTLKILGWIESYEKKIIAKREDETDNRISMVTNGQAMNSISSSITFFINLVALFTLVSTKPNITPGEILSLLWILGIFLTRPFRQMPWFFTFGFDGWTSVKRLSAFLTMKNSGSSFQEVISSPDANLEIAGPSIEVKNLSLKIRKKQVLKNIDFSVKPSEFVAIVGEVGSGKSLLLLSLIGETGADFNSYKINNANMLQQKTSDLCKYFAFVPQDGFVMSATLRENIAFDYEVSTKMDSRMNASLLAAQFNLEKENLIEKLDTEIGERGVNLSGGQKQRVGLARADFYDCPALLLDDCLSALDVNTEKLIIESLLKGKWKHKTRLLATHRLSILNEVDRIIFLDEGEIQDQGTLEELFARSEKFKLFIKSLEEKNEEK